MKYDDKGLKVIIFSVLTNLAEPDDSYPEYKSISSSTLKLSVFIISLIVTTVPLIDPL